MRSFPSFLVSVLTTVAIIALTTGTAASIVLFDNLQIANAQSEQLTTANQTLTQQEEEKFMIRQGIVTSSLDPLPGMKNSKWQQFCHSGKMALCIAEY